MKEGQHCTSLGLIFMQYLQPHVLGTSLRVYKNQFEVKCHSLTTPPEDLASIASIKMTLKLLQDLYRFLFKRFNKSSYADHHLPELSNKTVIFNMESSLLKSSSLFPYFMLVAFEAGSLFRALILLALYPLIFILGEDDLGMNLMVLVCFLGIKAQSFRAGRAVLPKFFLEDVGFEAFEVLKRAQVRVAVTGLPQVMVESFLKEYLGIEFVVGRQLKVFNGYFLGVLIHDDENNNQCKAHFKEILIRQNQMSSAAIGITSYSKSFHPCFSYCQEVHKIRRLEKRKWRNLPREEYPRPMIFHDGRLAFRPVPSAALAMFLWLPFGFTLGILRVLIGISLPFKVSIPLLAYSGLNHTVQNPLTHYTQLIHYPARPKTRGRLFVCNHRTLLDPLYLSFSLHKQVTAVTYSISRVTEVISPIKTVRLTRNREHDGQVMKKLLRQGDLVVCPEGTTCREPYLLRFSSLFAELNSEIVPVAIRTEVSGFYGTTAAGMKSLDPLFFMMNPAPVYQLEVLEMGKGVGDGAELANGVQVEIGKALGFQCTSLTRRDKYLILAGTNNING